MLLPLSSLYPAGWAFSSKNRAQHQLLDYALDCMMLCLSQRMDLLSLSLFLPQVSRLALDPLKIIAMDDFTKVFMTANHLGIINNQKPQSITPLLQTCEHLVIGGLPFILLNQVQNKSCFKDPSGTAHSLFQQVLFTQCIFFHPFTFSLIVSLTLKSIS